MRHLVALAVVLVSVTSVSAAPVPKAIKKQPTSPDGTWELTEFHSHGVKQNHQNMTKIWHLEGETFHVGPKGKGSQYSLTTPNPDNPSQRRFIPSSGGVGYPAVLELVEGELRFCYSGDPNSKITECKPAGNVYYYVFKRVEGEK
jgi:hypothetical protein